MANKCLHQPSRPYFEELGDLFYRFEFQKRGTLHLHMLVWVKDISATRADLLHASVPWANAEDAFTVASIQKSDKSCLPVREYPDFFITDRNGRHSLQFQHTEDDAERHIRAYVTTLLGSLHCRTDVQLADGMALLLKYVSSYVTKMHESATSEGLYCTDVTGYQAAHSFLRTVTPLEPEMVFQLSNIKVCWMDKFTVLLRPPFPDQTEGNKVYKLYLERLATEDDQTLLQWLRCHQTSGSKVKPYTDDRVLVGVKYVSLFNPIFFYQHLTMNWPHRNPHQLRHAEEDTMPNSIKHFAQSIALTPQFWDTADTITAEFEHEGHKSYFINTIVSYVQSLHDILYFGEFVSSLIKSRTSPHSLWNRSTPCHRIKPPYSQTLPPPFHPANLLSLMTTILLPRTPSGKNTVFFWVNLALGSHKY